MSSESREFITGVLFWGLLIFIWWFLFGRDIQPDLSSDFEEREGRYYESDGNGHPLWR